MSGVGGVLPADGAGGFEFESELRQIGGEAVGGPPSTFTSLIHDEIARWRQVAKEAAIHIE